MFLWKDVYKHLENFPVFCPYGNFSDLQYFSRRREEKEEKKKIQNGGEKVGGQKMIEMGSKEDDFVFKILGNFSNGAYEGFQDRLKNLNPLPYCPQGSAAPSQKAAGRRPKTASNKFHSLKDVKNSIL